MSHYKIKLDDKAAFLNRLEKQDVRVDSYDITDNKLKGYFEIDVTDEQANTIIKSILKSSPKINTVKEMKTKITKSQLVACNHSFLDFIVPVAYPFQGGLETNQNIREEISYVR